MSKASSQTDKRPATSHLTVTQLMKKVSDGRGKSARTYVAVIGAGVFGAWTAWIWRKAGAIVLLVDAYGPAHTRSSSGGESRIIRMGYGADEIYTRWSNERAASLEGTLRRAGRPELFQRTGVLWIATNRRKLRAGHHRHSQQVGVRFEKLSNADSAIAIRKSHRRHFLGHLRTRKRRADGAARGPMRGRPSRRGPASNIEMTPLNPRPRQPSRQPPRNRHNERRQFSASTFVFACGPWLPKLFPELLGERIFPSRQEVFFFGVPPGDLRFPRPPCPRG